jgi:hypothetical protein
MKMNTGVELMIRETVQKFRKHRGGTDEWWYRREAWFDIREEAQDRFGLQEDEDETVVLKAFNEAWKADEAAVEGDQDSRNTAECERLEAKGLLVKTDKVTPEGRPVYMLTEAGEAAMARDCPSAFNRLMSKRAL